MFKGLANLANLGSLVKQAQQMGGKLQDLNQRLKAARATGTAGGGLVTVEVDGTGEVVRCQIDPSLLGTSATEASDREFLEDLLPPAINQALAKAKTLQTEAMQGMVSGFDLSSLSELVQSEPGDNAAKPPS